jgi:hemerythrin
MNDPFDGRYHMAFFEWKDAYSVGIAAIDVQHKKILELMNDLFESIRDTREDLIIKEVLDELVGYSNYHFGLETSFFKKYGYPKEKEHVVEHERFIERVSELMVGEKLNLNCVPAKTLEYLKEWFTNHMLRVDIEYSIFFRDMGVIQELEAVIVN